MMAEWLPVDFDDPKHDAGVAPRDVRIKLLISPYDLPDAVRGYFDGKISRFVIEFRYISEEPTRREEEGLLVFHSGRNSGRLYKIEVDVQTLKAQSVSLMIGVHEKVKHSIDRLASRHPGVSENYDAVKDAISQQRAGIFKDLAPA